MTSGTVSPTFNTPLALGCIEAELATEGTEIAVEVRDRTVDATVVNQRFLDTLDPD